MPRFPERCPPGPAPPVRKEGLFATAGRPEPVPPPGAAPPLVAIAVGKTKDGESFPAKPAWRGQLAWPGGCDAQEDTPSFEYPVPLGKWS